MVEQRSWGLFFRVILQNIFRLPKGRFWATDLHNPCKERYAVRMDEISYRGPLFFSFRPEKSSLPPLFLRGYRPQRAPWRPPPATVQRFWSGV